MVARGINRRPARDFIYETHCYAKRGGTIGERDPIVLIPASESLPRMHSRAKERNNSALSSRSPPLGIYPDFECPSLPAFQ